MNGYKNPSFSTNIASLIGLAGAIHHLKEVLGVPEGGIIAFQSGFAKSLGFDPRHEPDPSYLDNAAHANVYSSGGDSERKRRAKKLAQQFNLNSRHGSIVKQPTFSVTP